MNEIGYVTDFNLDYSKIEISDYQKKLCFALIFDISKNRFKKSEFDYVSQVESRKSQYKTKINSNRILYQQNYLKMIHDLMILLYMVDDRINLCKLITNFK